MVGFTPTRRDLLVAAAALGASTSLPANGRAAEPSGPKEIRPFRIEVPEEALVDLRRRVAMTRWPDKQTVSDESRGVPLAWIQEIAGYWGLTIGASARQS
jgi:Epoxide hydrolase N terminus